MYTNQNTVFWGLLLHDKKMPIWILSTAVSKPANKNEEYRENGRWLEKDYFIIENDSVNYIKTEL